MTLRDYVAIALVTALIIAAVRAGLERFGGPLAPIARHV